MRIARLAVLLFASVPFAAHAGELQDDLKARRARVMEKIGPEAVAILWSAPPRLYSLDVEYEYRQDSNLLYLTGLTQEDTILLLMPSAKTKKEVLFVREPNPRREHWNGHTLTKQEATEKSGVETVYFVNEFEPFLAAMLERRAYGLRRGVTSDEWDGFFGNVAAGRARLSLVLFPKPGISGPLGPPYQFANKVRERYFGVAIDDATDVVHNLRLIKTPYEQKVLAKSLEISNEAHKAGMRAARPGRFEYEVEAAIEQVYLSNGAMSWGYPSIVGSGPNATILHYGESSRRMEPGDLLLVDAAANYQGLTGDITRTYPVSGSFSESQKDLYRIVVAAQDAAMKAAKAGNKTSDIEKASEEVVKAELLKLGLITDTKGEQFRTFYTHGICHWIGMDVHDVGDYKLPLQPGMAFVIEPGIYVREAALENLPQTPENKAFAEKVKPAVQKYKNLGVRLEDSFLLTDAGLKRLSYGVPRTIEEIETFLRRERTPTQQ
jgi:Xaa-Pro aminopeptidase